MQTQTLQALNMAKYDASKGKACGGGFEDRKQKNGRIQGVILVAFLPPSAFLKMKQ
jgi:hypothetical protein